MNTRTEVDVSKRDYQVVDDNGVVRRQRVVRTSSSDADGILTAQNVVYTLYGLLAGLLGIRILLSLLAANRANQFADFIYGITLPFVSPFRNLFRIDTTIPGTGSRFEVETIVAIAVYGLIAWGIIRLIGISHPTNRSI